MEDASYHLQNLAINDIQIFKHEKKGRKLVSSTNERMGNYCNKTPVIMEITFHHPPFHVGMDGINLSMNQYPKEWEDED
jgi:hypothetical protein